MRLKRVPAYLPLNKRTAIAKKIRRTADEIDEILPTFQFWWQCDFRALSARTAKLNSRKQDRALIKKYSTWHRTFSKQFGALPANLRLLAGYISQPPPGQHEIGFQPQFRYWWKQASRSKGGRPAEKRLLAAILCISSEIANGKKDFDLVSKLLSDDKMNPMSIEAARKLAKRGLQDLTRSIPAPQSGQNP